MTAGSHLPQTIRRLHTQGILTDPQAAFFLRVARRDLVSVRLELQAALYAGVMLIVAGVGVLVRERLQNIGPVTIGLGIALGAAACFLYVARAAPPFSRSPAPSPTLAFDYILLLGVLLLGADLAYLEVQFQAFGPNWPWHLLIVALIQLVLAYRYDSRAVLSLALASFAAWRGVAVSFPFREVFASSTELIRFNALLCGALFLAAGLFGKARDLKAHFEPVWGNVGTALLLGSAVSGIFSSRGTWEPFWWAALLALAGAAIVLAFRARRSDYFAQGVIAAYLGFLRLLAEFHLAEAGFFFISLSSLGVIALLVWAHRHMRDER